MHPLTTIQREVEKRKGDVKNQWNGNVKIQNLLAY